MTTTICLVRHGETDWNKYGKLQGQEDIELNDNGRKQAEGLGVCLGKDRYEVIISSTLSRAVETAEIISKRIGVEKVKKNKFLMERNYGSASGLTATERKMKFPDGLVSDQESIDALRKRVMGTLKAIAQNYRGKKILIVTHAGVIRAIVSALSKGEIVTDGIKIKNLSVTILWYERGKWEIVCFNKTLTADYH